ncbi:hypothetical protein [Corynebacterium tapiri]|uniref:Uncharacterized protein n=1 Tax=Corynebacterium tapiri TaxID=1448266 RepID=A0A5C4U6F0_9CORY|nr:hypothetical protein [Corynebacterium tapiri]TNM00456.1 hypothetical protein FHE74_00455 [Corynebacterium tapiri]
MGFLARWLNSEKLPELPEEALIADHARAEVRTAAGYVIVVLATDAAPAVARACRQRQPIQLRGGDRHVTITPVPRSRKVALDPEHGWIIPITDPICTALAAMTSTPHTFEFDGLAFVVE